TSFGDRLSGRRAMDRRRRSKGVVRAGEISPLVPPAAERSVGGRAGIADLRGSRLLNTTINLEGRELKTALASEARALGFDCVGVTDPDAIADAGRHLRAFLDAGAHGEMDWLAVRPERRAHSRILWKNGRLLSILCVRFGAP